MALPGRACASRKSLRQYAVALATFAACFVVLVFVVNTVIAGPLDFRFWQTSLALVSVHRWNEPAAMTATGAMHLLLPLVIGTVVVSAAPVRRAPNVLRSSSRAWAFYLGAYIFALLSMQSGLVRSDPNHIIFGVFPMVFFSGVILFSFSSRLASTAAALAAVVASLYLSEPAPIFHPDNIRYRLAQHASSHHHLSGGILGVRPRLLPQRFRLDAAVAPCSYLDQHSASE